MKEPKIKTIIDDDLRNLKKILRATTEAKGIKAPDALKESVKPILKELKKNYTAIAEAIDGYQERMGTIAGQDEVLCMNMNETGPVVIETDDDFIVLW